MRAAAMMLSVLLPAAALAEAVPVEVRALPGGRYTLLRGGELYEVRGAGGDERLALLASVGGNSIRTWGVGSQTRALLDAAHAQGLTVSVGIWLGHERHGFDYSDPQQLAAQRERVRQAVLAYKDHPAVLIWGLGNEMEGFGAGDDARIWNHIEDLASMVHEIDPDHPTMTVVAEIGGQRVQSIHELCPSIDIVGINSYGGVQSIPQRYRDAGGTKPYIVTEFGPRGQWESASTEWGAPIEPTSTRKAQHYRDGYDALEADVQLNLGSYAFTWGSKIEATTTWFGMLLDDGSILQAVDELSEAWTGEPPANRSPRIDAFDPAEGITATGGTTFSAALDAWDPDGDAISVEYIFSGEVDPSVGGDAVPPPPEYPDAILEGDTDGVLVRAPAGGHYRLYAIVRDGNGAAATANIPIEVVAAPAERVSLPFYVYRDGEEPQPWSPSGWMGDTGAISMDFGSALDPHAGQAALRVAFASAGGWGGVAWQNPSNDWGDLPGGYDLRGAQRFSFWARGEQGGERVRFGFGLLDGDEAFPDSDRGEIEVQLTAEWAEYGFGLGRKDLSRIKTGFYWIVSGQGSPIAFHLDEIRYEGCGTADVAEPYGSVNVTDLLGYLQMFRDGAPGADMDGAGAVNVQDLLSYLGAFRAGCSS